MTNYQTKYYKYRHRYLQQVGNSNIDNILLKQLKTQKCCKKAYDVCYRKDVDNFKLCPPKSPPLHCVAGVTIGRHIKEITTKGTQFDQKVTDPDTGEKGWLGLCCPGSICESTCPGIECGIAQNQYDKRYYGKVLGKTEQGRQRILTNMTREATRLTTAKLHQGEDRLLAEVLLSKTMSDHDFITHIRHLQQQDTYLRLLDNVSKKDRTKIKHRVERLSDAVVKN